DTTPKYNNILVARNNGKIVKKTTTVKKTTPFKRPMPINSRKADITENKSFKPKYQKSISVLKANITDISIKEILSDTEMEEPTEEPNIMAIFSNYTDAKKACIHPILKCKNSKPRLVPTLSTYKINCKLVRIWDISKKDIAIGFIKFDLIEYIKMHTTGLHKLAVVTTQL
ncbi:12426_t:CDS:2, partial [Acaulospora morrowiae]